MNGINQINTDKSLLELLFNLKNKQNTATRNIKQGTGLDTISISGEARQLVNTNKSSGSSANTTLDKSINLQSYLDETDEINQESIANAGDSIKSHNSYASKSKAYRAALNDKYTKLVSTAKQHSDPESYIYQKYYNQSCSWYETGLLEKERQIAYNYEMNVLENGQIRNIKMGDSLFRNLKESTVTDTELDISFNRNMMNAQISNILQNNSITVPSDITLTYRVDPYSYYISVSGGEETLMKEIEQALNVGENGKNLYYHIRRCSIQDGAESEQTSEMGYKKYQLYHQVQNLTGLDISTLIEKDGTYFTEDGSDILDLVNQKVGESKDIPNTHKASMREWIAQMVSDVAKRGWNHIKDLSLEIDYQNNTLIDKYQKIQYG